MAELFLKNISLSYPVYGSGAGRSLVTAAKSISTGGVIRRTGHRHVEVDALADVHLTARDGDRIGILGHNGAGKTTLLKVAAGILKPDKGRIRRVGRTVAVINPAVGLSPNLTGYENIEQIALLYGMSRGEIAELRPDVQDFSELGEFLDLPVSTYSPGMKTRLAFGVATAFQPDILVADENIGTGDATFVKKARDRMRVMMDRASILLLATHSVKTIETLCSRAILMEHGRVIADGDVTDIVSRNGPPRDRQTIVALNRSLAGPDAAVP